MPPDFFLQIPPLLTACRQISREASEYVGQYIVIEIMSTYIHHFKYGLSYYDEVVIRVLLDAMLARASRFENVIELQIPQANPCDMLFYLSSRERHRHVGVTGPAFPKLEKLVWWGKGVLRSESVRFLEAQSRSCFEQPDLEVEYRRYVWPYPY